MANNQPIQKQHPKKGRIIWLVGGGTGGHIMPLMAVAEELSHRPAVKLTYIGDASGPESEIAKKAGLSFVHIPSGKLRRYFGFTAIILNIRDIFLILAGIILAYRLIRRKKPSLIFSKGGPVALPVALAAYITRTPLMTHESDVVMGITNRIIGTFAKTIMTAFPASFYPTIYARKIVSVGVPIRREFCHHPTIHHQKRPMILITGGSQGARAINLLVGSILPDLLRQASVMHICGKYSFKEFQELKKELPDDLAAHYGLVDFTPDIASYMREAALVITRASSTIFEVATLGKPMIIIPLPGSANDHQLKNAEAFLRYKAALVLKQNNLTPNLLYETIQAVLQDKKVMRELVEGTRHFSCCDSARQVATLLLQASMQVR